MSAVVAGLDPVRSRAEDAEPVPVRHRSAAGATAHLGAASPWRRMDAVVAGTLALLGAVVVGVCWNGASREAAFRDQIGWTVAAMAGVGVFALGGGFWLLVGFRRTRCGLAQLGLDFETVYGPVAVEGVADHGAPGPVPLVTADGMRLAHRGDCLLVHGKTVRSVGAEESELFPRCAMCHP